ncbi:MAG: sn-glycerol-3-phosphate ABC transporter ATP-binding protein UgpC [Cocleimonas sp.]
MSTIELKGITKDYGDVSVIKGVDINIESGEFTILVGPSGCGKSTLLRMLAGLESITAGTISIDGRIVNDLLPKDRDIAMVFQNYALYPHMTVAANMGFSLRLAKISKTIIRQKVDSAASILGLHDLLERYPRQLSGGQRQRVAMGRAIVRNPSVFLFDEPLSNLDAKLRVRMRSEIKALHKKLKTTIVYVTHDQVEAMTMADKIIVLDGGHVSQVGSSLELYDTPSNKFVASFIGSPSMNLVPVEVIDSKCVRLQDGQKVDFVNQITPGRNVTFGIRPEHLELSRKGEGVTTQVTTIESTGAETLVACSIKGVEFLAALRGRVDLIVGEEVSFSFDQSRVHIFCAETGQRL